MRKTLLALLTVGVLAACSGQPSAPVKHADSVSVKKDGEPCTTSDGRSGYVVTSGFQTYCQAS